MRVCFFLPSLGDGGAQRQCVALLNLLQLESNIDLHLILLGRGRYESDLDTTRITVHRTAVSNFGRPAALGFVVRTLRRIRPQVLMSWLHPADIWSYPATRIVRNVRWIAAERGSFYPDELNYNLRTRLISLGADLVIANSAQGKHVWASVSPSTPVRVIPNLLLSTPPAAEPFDRTGLSDCLYVGRFMPQKNVTGIAFAFTLFAAAHAGPQLLMAGQGEQLDDVRQIAARAGAESRIRILGFRDDVPSLMAKSRLLLSFSTFEGMPNVVMEAIAAGLPVLVSDIPEHRALLGPEYPYYLDLNATPADGARMIERAWNEGPGLSAINYAHASAVLENSAPEKVVAAYLDAFDSVLAGGGRRALVGQGGSADGL